MMRRLERPRDPAIRVLARVLSDGRPLDQALAEFGDDIPAASRAWLQEVSSGTLRWKTRLEQAVDSAALKKKPSGWLRRALLIGAYQLIAQEKTQPALVVSETVSQIKRKEGDAPARFANACLRKIADHASEWRELTFPATSSMEEQARWASMPQWMWLRLVNQHGAGWARDYSLSCLERPAIWIRARRAEWEPDWASRGPLAHSWRVSQGGAIPEKPGFREGEFIVQDISSQKLVAEISQEVRGAGGLSALDLCAAPGGKSVGMAWSGLQVTATDRDASRLALLEQTLARVQAAVRIAPRDAAAQLPPQDLVWVDAPCTGSGIIRRHPDVRWLHREADLAGLGEVQRQLIQEGWSKVRPGGFFAYSVCSVFKEEGPDRVSEALLSGSRIREWLLAPQENPGGDGFWAVLIRKS